MWDQRFLVSFFTFLVLVRLIHFIKEECQALCKNATACQGFTHYNANASPRANFCETFPTTNSSIPCANCVSGPSSCFCSGEVKIQKKYLKEIIFQDHTPAPWLVKRSWVLNLESYQKKTALNFVGRLRVALQVWCC